MMKMDAPKSPPRTKLIEARLQRKLSQQQLAERIGTNYVNVSRWERGITRPGPYFRRKLSQLFGKTEEELDLALAGEANVSLPNVPTSKPAAVDLVASLPESANLPAPAPVAAASVNEAMYDPSIPLPPPVHLVGREGELAELKQRLRAGDNVAMTALHGLPGVGKTTLAITLAHDAEMHAHFRDGILWAGLGPAPDVSSVLSRWSLLLGIATPDMTGESDHEGLALLLRRAIGARQMLLVIDDAWQLEDALVFKVGGPNCAHLVTTRFPGIASAFAPRATSVIHELGENESMVLLRMLAPQGVERETEKARELAQAVGGLPLALTLLGNYLRLQSYSGQARRVDAALARLSDAEARLRISEPRGPAERHTSLPLDMPLSLQSVIDVSGQQLDPQAKAALYALSVFPPRPNNFSEEAALYVANCNVATLDTLIDTGLLESADASHYTLHQTIADYARAALQDDVAPHERLITFTTDFVEKHKKDYEILEPEYNSIIAALEASHTLDKIQQLMRCVYAFIPYLRSRGLYELAEKQLQRAYAGAVKLGDDDGKSQALLYLGEIAQKRGNYEQANAYLQDGLRLARQLANPERISAILADLGWITSKRGEYTRAETYLQEGLVLAEQIDNSELICDTLETLGSVAGSRGEYDKSKIYEEQALTIARKIGDREKICTLLINLGVTAGEQGNHIQAEEYFQEALILARQLGHKEWTCALLSNLGDIASEKNEFNIAEGYFQEGLALAHQFDNREWISALLTNIGLTKRKQGNFDQAEVYLRDGLALARQIGIPQVIANVLYEYGNFYFELTQVNEAEETYRHMLRITPDGTQDLIALAHYGLGRVAAAQGKLEEAIRLGDISIILLETLGHRKTFEVKNWLHSVEIEKI
jgi:tetratricopeptide (TPR) repeat protein/transcriptional regulator with XRE-family HTH domain